MSAYQSQPIYQPHDNETYMSITRITSRMEFMIVLHFRWRLVVGSSPPQDLVFAMHFDDFLLVVSDERAVVSLIESPLFIDGNVFLAHLHQDHVDGTNGSS